MPKYVGWDETSEKGKGSGQFLKLEAGKKYRVRLVSNAVQYFQHWEPVICRSPGVDPKTGKVVDPLMLANHTPKKRYAIWVFNRDEGNKLQVMDFPPTLFDQFVEWKTNFNANPGGENGPDWSIKLEVPGTDRRRTKYKATHLEKAPFTEEELKVLNEGITVMVDGKETKMTLKARLADLRRENTPEEIRAMMEAKGDPSGPRSSAKPAAAAEPEEKPESGGDGYDF